MSAKTNPVSSIAPAAIAKTPSRKLEGLDRYVLDARAQLIPASDTGEHITVKILIGAALMSHKAPALEALRVFELAEKIRHSETNVDLAESEHALLKSIVEKNEAGWNAIMLAQVYRLLV